MNEPLAYTEASLFWPGVVKTELASQMLALESGKSTTTASQLCLLTSCRQKNQNVEYFRVKLELFDFSQYDKSVARLENTILVQSSVLCARSNRLEANFST